MLKTTTIRIDEKLHQDATDYIKKLGISGGFSAYVQAVIKYDLSKNVKKLKEDK